MIIASLHRQMVALDRRLHRELRVHQPETDWSMAAHCNALFVAGAEFGDVCREYPILFVRSGADAQGRPQMAPIAALGLAPNENLYLQGKGWRASYLPALLRAYPFALGQAGVPPRAVLSIDIGWPGLSQTEGLPLFDAAGEPGEHLVRAQEQLQKIEQEVQRTRELCRLLLASKLLREMRFDAELPGGEKLKVDGFFTVDDKQLGQLPDAEVLALQRNGALGLIYAHLVSLGNLRKLVQWRGERETAQATDAPS